jgi:DNA-binding GntR family transcriptional regulator
MPGTLPKTQELARTSVYHQIRSDILTCKLRPGVQFQEKDLVSQFEVSKSPIRDALLKLEELGLVEVMPRKGYRVRRIDLSDVRDMYQLRVMYERECISLMIDQAPDEVLAALDRFREGPLDDELSDWIDYNRNFHADLVIHCGNARLARSALELNEHFDRLTYLSVSHSADLSLTTFVQEHGEIIDAIQARKRRQAIALSRAHIDSSRSRVLEELGAASIVDTSRESLRT